MNINDCTYFCYSLFLHRYKEYNSIKYNYNIPKNMYNQMKIFFENNKFGIQDLTQYTKSEVQLRLIINYFINNSNIIEKVSQAQYDLVYQSLTEYKNEFSLFKAKNYKSTKDIYTSYIKKEIPFYIFYYTLRFVKFQESFLTQELIKNKMIIVCKLMQFFTFFDEEWIKEDLKEYQKIVDFT